MEISRIGRTTAYDENPERGHNAIGIIRPFGKGVVTPAPSFPTPAVTGNM